MSAAVTIEFDHRTQYFTLTCEGCGWTGRTTRLPTIAVPAGEHVRGCDGQRHRRHAGLDYDADAFDPNRHHEPHTKSVDPESPRRKPPTGAKREKLTPDKVREIRQRSAAGESLSLIASAFGVSTPNVHAIISRRSWKHI